MKLSIWVIVCMYTCPSARAHTHTHTHTSHSVMTVLKLFSVTCLYMKMCTYTYLIYRNSDTDSQIHAVETNTRAFLAFAPPTPPCRKKQKKEKGLNVCAKNRNTKSLTAAAPALARLDLTSRASKTSPPRWASSGESSSNSQRSYQRKSLPVWSTWR
jgi:hypothetical protein